ncbi:hypothetical protein BDZ97DRAFT_1934475 [Flammula alnicola]|nr:hypothetical protein BDZ97DRAFT_1934475 [Flammula alnicola]
MAPLPIITPRVNLPLPCVNVRGNPEERELTLSEDGIPEENSPENGPSRADDGESELSELETDIESDELIRPAQKIPKPSGEPGRPNSGGYCIEDALMSWGKDEFGKVVRFTKKIADAKLDQTKSYSKQDRVKVARNYPIVDKYEDRWPVRGILKMHLKATSENFRKGKKVTRA